MNDKLVLKGHGYFERRRKDGSKIDSWEKDNLIVTAGMVQVSKLLNGVSTNEFNTIAIGTGESADAVVVGDTALKNEIVRESAVLTYEATAKAVFANTFSFISAEEYAIT